MAETTGTLLPETAESAEATRKRGPRQRKFELAPGELWPKTPHGVQIAIPIIGATGDFESGKTILGLSIAPGAFKDGPFAGLPRTRYYDFEKSGSTYHVGAGVEYIDVQQQVTALYTDGKTGQVKPYNDLDIYAWFIANVTQIPAGRYDVIMADPVTDIENGIMMHIQANPEKYGFTANQLQKATGAIWGAVKSTYKAVLLSLLASRCKVFYFTSHLRDEWAGNSPTGRREPKGKETLMELASLYLWLDRDVIKAGPEAGTRPDEPAANVIKQRISDIYVGKDGELEKSPLLPARLPKCTVAAIRGYIASPIKDARPDERAMPQQVDPVVLQHLELSVAQAKQTAAESGLKLLNRQQELRQLAGLQMAPSQPVQESAGTNAEPKVFVSSPTAPEPIGADQLQELGRLFTTAIPDPEKRRGSVMNVLEKVGKGSIKDLTQAEFATLRAKLTEAIAKQQPQQQSPVVAPQETAVLPTATTAPAVEPAPQQKQEATPTQAEVDAANAKADASMAELAAKGQELASQSTDPSVSSPANGGTVGVNSAGLVTLPQLTKLRELMNELVPADKQRDWIKNVLTRVNKPSVKELSQGEWSALTTRMEMEIAKRKLAANPT